MVSLKQLEVNLLEEGEETGGRMTSSNMAVSDGVAAWRTTTTGLKDGAGWLAEDSVKRTAPGNLDLIYFRRLQASFLHIFPLLLFSFFIFFLKMTSLGVRGQLCYGQNTRTIYVVSLVMFSDN